MDQRPFKAFVGPENWHMVYTDLRAGLFLDSPPSNEQEAAEAQRGGIQGEVQSGGVQGEVQNGDVPMCD